MTMILPGGVWRAGKQIRRVHLRALNGEDERFLLESASALLPVERVTALLNRCLVDYEGWDHSPVSLSNLARDLTIGDREAILLHLRQLTYGDQIPCVVSCPHADCGEKMDLMITASQLLLAPYPNPSETYTETWEGKDGRWKVRFRLPTGADQEAAALTALADPSAALADLLATCIIDLSQPGNGNSTEAEPGQLPEGLQDWLETRLQELDPQAEIRISLTCTGCGRSLNTLFDTASYLFQDAHLGANQLYQDIHVLALYYHWSESEILSLPVTNRKRYLGFLEMAFQEAGLA